MRRSGFKFQINYHSAAQLLLYGVGWQVATPSPDDLIYEAMAGDDAKPGGPRLRPGHLRRALHHQRRDRRARAEPYGTLAFTPEMSTCETASASDPDDAFDPADCDSVFNFPDSEALIQAEFEKNIPFAIALAKLGACTRTTRSRRGRTAPTSTSTPSTVSYGDPQPVAVTARRDLRHLTHALPDQRRPDLHGPPSREWKGRRAIRRREQRLLRRVPRHR